MKTSFNATWGRLNEKIDKKSEMPEALKNEINRNMDYSSLFLIDSSEKINQHLSILLKNKCLLTAYFGDDDNEDSFITTLFEIDKKEHVFIFYHGPKEEAIDALLNSSKITFKTVCLGVEVVFDTLGLANIRHNGLPAFAVPIPESMLWMERREFYRLKAPLSNTSYCQLNLQNQVPIKLKLYDISISGFSMLADCKAVLDLMILYSSFEQCKFILDGKDADTITFEIRSKYVFNPESLNRMEKIGCRFTQITPAFQNTIQRYMQQIERANRLRTGSY